MSTDTRIKANTVNNLLSIQPLHLCIGIQFIEVANTQSQISISKQLNRFCFGKTHEQSVNVFLDCTFLKQFSKSMCSFYQPSVFYIRTNDDSGRVKVIIQSLALTQKFRAEDNIVAVIFFADTCCEANRNRGLYHHNCFRVILNYQFDNRFNCRGIKEIFLAVIVGRSCNDNKISIRIRFLGIQSCSQIQLLFCQILLNVFVPNRRFLVIDHLHLLRNDIQSRYLMVLCQQHCQRKPNISRTGHGNFQIFKLLHYYFLPCILILRTHSSHTHSC